MAGYYYGVRAVMLLAVCMASSAAFDFVGVALTQPRTKPPYDFSAIFIGAAIALMLPASFSYSLAVVGCAFAVIVAKIPFGTAHNAPFVPAAAGFAFLCVCWPTEVFNYPEIGAKLSLLTPNPSFVTAGSSLTAMLQAGNAMRLSSINVLHLLTGSLPGPMGTGAILVLLAAAFYFLFTRPSALLSTLGFLLACGAVALIFPRVKSYSLLSLLLERGSQSFMLLERGELFSLLARRSFSSLMLELCSGSLVFVGLFLLTADTAQSPKKPLPRLLYGVFTGFVCMLLRHFGVFEEGACFAVLLANAVWPFAGIRMENLRKAVIKSPATPPVDDALKTGGGADAG